MCYKKKKPADYIQSNHLNKTPLYHGQFSDKILIIFPLKRLKKTPYINGKRTRKGAITRKVRTQTDQNDHLENEICFLGEFSLNTQWRRLESIPILSHPVSGFCWASVALQASLAPSALTQSTCGKYSLYPREKGEIIHIN